MMRAMYRLIPLLSSFLLVACGGGGGSGGAIQPPDTVNVAVQPTLTTLGVNSLTDVAVNVTRRGTGVADGTAVTLSVDQPALGQVGAASGATQSFNNSATASTSGGVARFRFKSTTATGTAVIRASVNDPNTPSVNIVAQTSITLNGGPSNDTRLTLSATRTTIPVNINNQPPFIGSPFEVEVTATWRNLRGELVIPRPDDASQAAWTSPDNIGGISRPDDPETTNVNEYLQLFQAIVVGINSGRGTIFVRSTDTAGTGRLTVATVDQDTGEHLSATLNFTMTSGTPGLPGAVRVTTEGAAAYSVGSGGPTSRQLRVFVTDGAGNQVPNPEAGGVAFNNVRLEILNAQGERLSTVGANGSNQTGTTVNTRTFNGIAGALFLSSTRQGTVTVRATSDRADNNVDNGITDPVIGENSVVVSDGRLFSLRLTTPGDGLFVNPYFFDEDTFIGNGTYSLIVSAIALDRLGNPVIPGTEIQFGLIDSPASTGLFDISGLDGDPVEGGTQFTAPGGQFTTAGGGAGAGDTLVLFGQEVVGARDLESARILASVNSATSATVTRRFNFNDDTGQSVNLGPVIPYVIGRATVGNINAQAVTNDIGVASTLMNYPVSQLGRLAIVWAQSNGVVVAGEAKTVGDVDTRSFAGVGPLVVTASPNQIPGNTTTSVTACVEDAQGNPLRGVGIGFAFTNLTTGTGSIDGQANSGVVGPTGADGCVTTSVTTAGIVASQGQTGPGIRFFAGGGEDTVSILVGQQVLQANPSAFLGSGGTVTLTLLSANGGPVAGVQLAGQCTSSGGAVISLTGGPGVTNASGQTTVTIVADNLNGFGRAGSGSCVFSAPGGQPSTTVQIQGIDQCQLDPTNPACGGTVTTFTLTIAFAGTGSGTVNGSAPPNGFSPPNVGGTFSCSSPTSCVQTFRSGTVVNLTAVPAAGSSFGQWSVNCSGTNPITSVTMSANRTCTATFNMP